MSHRTSILSARLLAAALTAPAIVAAPFAAAQDPVEVQADNVLLISNGVPAMPLGVPSLGAVSVVGSDTGAVVEGKPYSADAVTTTVQHLADGNRITQRNEMRVYRDSEGRTRRELRLGPPGAALYTAPAGMIMIHDPIAKRSFMLDANNETARQLPNFDVATAPVAGGGMRVNRVLRGPDAPEAPGEPGTFNVVTESFRAPLPAPGAGPARAGFFRSGPAILGQLDTRTEALGDQVLQGVRATGTRITRTIPAGAIGNERDIDIVSETWYSTELEADVLRRNVDPRTGETVYELVNIDRSEPPADLFTVPSGYETVNGPGRVDFQLQRELEWRSAE